MTSAEQVKPANTAQYDVSAGAEQVKPANTAQYDISAGTVQVKWMTGNITQNNQQIINLKKC